VSKKSKSPRKPSRWMRFLSYFVMFLVVIGLCLRPLSKKALSYQSFWGGAVFVPFVLLAAAIVLFIAFINRNRN
jgi:hypothetical protein